jgi:hypothetical protein
MEEQHAFFLIVVQALAVAGDGGGRAAKGGLGGAAVAGQSELMDGGEAGMTEAERTRLLRSQP